MEFIMGLLVYIIPFIVLYFVIAAGVKRGLDQSEVGRIIMEKQYEKNKPNNK
ncbi:hypothetical protein [Oceanobacillus damuensis]|uniref:hypothetical protein n=1 Tax=Oceanobacillus damuensis TaxID=937928 RepID=UPI000AD7BE11|nr:hypothetical protein [Oceanobacillus damuensis]